MRIRTRIKRFKGFGLEDLVGATCLTVMWVLYKASPEVSLNGSGKRYEERSNRIASTGWNTAVGMTHTATHIDHSAC